MINFSIIVPVYNRPDEVDELLRSLSVQSDKNFEVVIVEDGSSVRCESVCKKHAATLPALKYYYKENSGPGGSRNYGANHATGNYLIIFDSDCVIPKDYIKNARNELETNFCDAFGGADAAHGSFSNMQKAVNYAMTSLFTTGGIRGGKKKGFEKFHPRSFNMGISADVYKRLGGFSDMRYGEDIDFSIRIFEAGYSVRLFPDAYVYHKRRTDLRKFYRQIFHSGEARIVLWKKHPSSLKFVHFLPLAFVVGHLLSLVATVFSLWFLVPAALYALLVFIDATIRNKSIKIGFLSVVTSYTQLFGYGLGMTGRFFNILISFNKVFINI